MNDNEIYKNELRNAMFWLSQQPKTVFIGQSVEYEGTGLYDTLDLVPNTSKIEFPVAENFQLGYSIGLYLSGFVPVSIFPRWNFLICATDQIVNHLDKLGLMSDFEYSPKVIIRVAVGVRHPVDPQEQHVGDFTEAFKLMLKNVEVVKLSREEDILPAYINAYERNDGISTILVEEHQF